jgi:peroxiredoxin
VADTLRFTAPKVGGGSFDGASLAGKPAVLWFWAAWCPRCRAKADDVRLTHERFLGRVNVVGVAGLGSGDGGMRDFVAQHGLSGFPHLADDGGAVWRRFGVTEQEIFVLIDSTGRVVHKGALSASALTDRVGALAG